jgi:K+-transporting ATPase KdpF subunit
MKGVVNGLRHALCRGAHYGTDVRLPEGGGTAVSGQDIAGLIVGIAMLGYLIYALVRPEKF